MTRHLFASAAILAALVAGGPAFAKDKSEALPGVNGDYRIVKPAPEPDEVPQGLVADEEGFVMIGNTRVKISGLVRYEVNYESKTRLR